MINNSNSSSDDDTCSTVSFRNEEMMIEFALTQDTDKNEELEGTLVKIDAYSSTEDDHTSQVMIEEEEWSDRECRYLAQMNDPRYMTARQRSLLDKRSGTTNVEEISIDQIPSKESRAPRQVGKTGEHRRAAKERQQEEQRATVERLLKVTPGSRLSKRARQAPSLESDVVRSGPYIRILSTQREGCDSYIAFSDSDLCPTWTAPTVPPLALCSLPGCPNRKRYSCSRTGKPLCSLECYKANLLSST